MMDFMGCIDAFDVEDYLSQKGTVRKSGRTNVSCTPCPICGDRRGKFYANAAGGETNGLWNAYCCHDAGKLVDLVMRIEDIDRQQALSFIRASVEGETEKVIPVLESAPAAPAPAPVLEFPQPLYPATPETPYVDKVRGTIRLEERGVTQEIIDRWSLMVTGSGTVYKGRFRPDLDHRLVIPVRDPGTGGWLSWQGRDLTGRADAKYAFPSGIDASRALYGWDEHRASGCPTALLVEGVFHKWAWDSFGRRIGSRLLESAALATFGKSLSRAQEELLVSDPGIRRVIIAWDFDAAREIVKTAERLAGRKEVLVMPAHASGRDPDELGDAELMELMTAAVPYDRELAARLVVTAA